MQSSNSLNTARLANAWRELQTLSDQGHELPAEPSRIAFADPEFLLRRETRALRLQMEMLKPELELEAQQIDHTVVVYGGARVPSPERAQELLKNANNQERARIERNIGYYQDARAFGRIVAEHSKGKPREQHLYICTGGGPGIMEAANRGAAEAGEPTVGLNITLPFEQTSNAWVTPALNFRFHYFAMRKMHFMIRAAALVVFPGGFGTLDELFEVLTLVSTQKSRPVPIILHGSAYWHKVLNIEALLEEGMIGQDDVHLVHYVDTPEQAWQVILDYYQSPEQASKSGRSVRFS